LLFESPDQSPLHVPVLLEETMEIIAPKSGDVLLDCTVGTGGHSVEFLKRSAPDGKVIALDRDDEMLRLAREQFERHNVDATRYQLICGNYEDLEAILARLGSISIDAVLIDCGLSSAALDAGERGMSFLRDGPLLLVYERDAQYTAEDLVNTMAEDELSAIIRRLGEERNARRIARAIVAARREKRITRTVELAQIVSKVVPRPMHPKRIHPATKTFLAIRMFLNRELEALRAGVPAALRVVKPNGKVLVISYQSQEDRIVKQVFNEAARACVCPPEQPVCTCGGKPRFRVLTPKPISPTRNEIERNPRSRSAKLRAIEKIV
jgi:16S rRNA (cytosine1402-N4)-methyltransferase